VFAALPLFGRSIENKEFISGQALRTKFLLDAVKGLRRAEACGARRLEARMMAMPIKTGHGRIPRLLTRTAALLPLPHPRGSRY
jgi:hypothetical protein